MSFRPQSGVADHIPLNFLNLAPNTICKRKEFMCNYTWVYLFYPKNEILKAGKKSINLSLKPQDQNYFYDEREITVPHWRAGLFSRMRIPALRRRCSNDWEENGSFGQPCRPAPNRHESENAATRGAIRIPLSTRQRRHSHRLLLLPFKGITACVLKTI